MPLHVRSYGVEGGRPVVVSLNASILSPPFVGRVMSLPPADRGTLFQTTDGLTPSTPITTVPTVVSDARQRVIYLPPLVSNKTDYSTRFTSFSFTVSNAQQGWSASMATASLFVAHQNLAPSITTMVASGDPANPGLLMAQDGALSLAAAGIVVSDPDAGSNAIMQLNITAVAGIVSFPSSASLTASQRAALAPWGAPPLSRANFTLLASMADLNALVAAAVFEPVKGFIGTASLGLTVSDRGQSGLPPSSGPAALTAATVVYLGVQRLNQPITVALLGSSEALVPNVSIPDRKSVV